MSHTHVSDALAHATAHMVAPHDVTGALFRLVVDATDALGVDAAAVLVTCEDRLEVLTATSHRVEDLEVYQLQADEGPCVDTIRSGTPATVAGASDLVARWPSTGPRIVAAGYSWVHAAPLVWRGRVFGALNVFDGDGPQGEETGEAVLQSFADAATMLILSGGIDDDGVLRSTLQAALARRALVEQAKGAFAQVRSLCMEDAYSALRDFARGEQLWFGAAAEEAVDRARKGVLR